MRWWLQLSGQSIGSSGSRPWVQSSVTASFSLASISTYIDSMHLLVPSTHRKMRMNLNWKTLVRQKYCTECVDFRCTNLQTSYHTFCTAGYWKKLGGAILKVESLFCCLLCGQCTIYSNSRLSFVACTTAHHVNHKSVNISFGS